jgi:hypothetical protein
MLAWSMGRVGLIDITVGSAARLGASQGPPRDAARRTTSLRNARAAGDIPAALARLARHKTNASYRQRTLTRVSCPMIASIDTKLEPFIGSNVPPRKPLTRSVETQL